MARVLLVGPERKRTSEVRGLLREDGHQIWESRYVQDWREREGDVRPDVVVAAVENPGHVLSAAGRPTRGFPPPLLFVQHDADFCRDLHLEDRLVDRIASPFLCEEFLARIDALARVRQVILGDRGKASERDKKGRFGGLGRRLAAWLGSRVPRHEKPLAPYLEVAARLADWADSRDAFEPGHAERVMTLCAIMAEGLSLEDEETSILLRAAMLHDIGKVALPIEILHQRTPLKENQRRLIRTHPRRGAALLEVLDGDSDVNSAILYHHERPDGGGYYGMPADRTPRTAKVLATAEVYDAMTSSRVKEPVRSDRALEMLGELKGEAVDADCVEALVSKLAPRPKTIPLVPGPR